MHPVRRRRSERIGHGCWVRRVVFVVVSLPPSPLCSVTSLDSPPGDLSRFCARRTLTLSHSYSSSSLLFIPLFSAIAKANHNYDSSSRLVGKQACGLTPPLRENPTTHRRRPVWSTARIVCNLACARTDARRSDIGSVSAYSAFIIVVAILSICMG